MKNPLGKQESDARALTEQIEEEAERLARQVSTGSGVVSQGVANPGMINSEVVNPGMVNPETVNLGMVNLGVVGERVLEQETGVMRSPAVSGRVDPAMRQLGQTVAESAYIDRVEGDLARGNLEERRSGLPGGVGQDGFGLEVAGFGSEVAEVGPGPEPAGLGSELIGNELRNTAERDALAGEELVRDEIALNDPLAVVGTETPGQAEQRIEEDLADLHTEEGTGLTLENQVAKQATTKIVQEVANAADDLMRQRSFRVKDLENLYSANGEKIRGGIFGRWIGGRNN